MREQQTETEDIVKLKLVMGIRPGIYLTVLYSIILLALVFLFLFLPGIRNPGAVLSIKTEPAGAAIRVDGVYMGTVADKIFVPKGSHTLQAVLPGFESEVSSHEIPSRVFASLFFPRRYKVEFTLKTGNPVNTFAAAASDFASWTFAGEPVSTWQIPLSLSEGAYRAAPYMDLAAKRSADEILKAASRFTVTRAALRDIVRAKTLLDASGQSPSFSSLADSASDILAFLSENPGSAGWLASLLPPESAAVVKDSLWYKNETAEIVSDLRITENLNIRQFNLAGLNFVSAGGFLISETPVSDALFKTFLNENPSLAADREKEGGNLTETFLNISTGNEAAALSWYEAEAFCKWLTEKLPPSMAEMEAALPSQAEWENAEAAGIFNTENSLWEWCADPFAPLQFIKADFKAVNAVGSSECVLLRANSSFENRASLPPEFSSPFVTFRPVIRYRYE